MHKFDCVVMLGLLRHPLVSERATLPSIVELLASFDTRAVIAEWIERHDRRFEQIAGINAARSESLGRKRFEAVSRKFAMEARQELPGATRTLYTCARESRQ